MKSDAHIVDLFSSTWKYRDVDCDVIMKDVASFVIDLWGSFNGKIIGGYVEIDKLIDFDGDQCRNKIVLQCSIKGLSESEKDRSMEQRLVCSIKVNKQ